MKLLLALALAAGAASPQDPAPKPAKKQAPKKQAPVATAAKAPPGRPYGRSKPTPDQILRFQELEKRRP